MKSTNRYDVSNRGQACLFRVQRKGCQNLSVVRTSRWAFGSRRKRAFESHTMGVVPSDDSFTPGDCIEVVVVREGDHVKEKIYCVSPSSRQKRPARLACVPSMMPSSYSYGNHHNNNSSSSSRGYPTSMFEAISNTFMNSCVGCEPCAPKSVLRKGPRPREAGSRNVSFKDIDIKEFNMTLGHHPSAVTGPPVSLDWDHVSSQRTMSLDEYEESRAARRDRRRLKLSYKQRQALLSQQFTQEEINKEWAQALTIRQQRQETLQRGPLSMIVDDFFESANRKASRLTNGIVKAIL